MKKSKKILLLTSICLALTGLLYLVAWAVEQQFVTDSFDTNNPNSDPEYYTSSKENLVVLSGQVKLVYDVCYGISDNTQVAGCDGTCQTCQSDACGVANAGTDPGDDCGTTDCYTGNCKGTTAVCDWYTTEDRACAVCQTCVGATSGSCLNYSAYNEDTDCTTQCTGCSGGSCVNIPNGTADTWGSNTCTATHYRCNGDGACTAPKPTTCRSYTGWCNTYCTAQGFDGCVNACYSNCTNCFACHVGYVGGGSCLCWNWMYD